MLARRVFGWWSGHPRTADALLAAVACGYLLIEVPYVDYSLAEFDRIPWWFWADLLAFASLAWRRFPRLVLALVWTLWLVGGRWDIWAEWNDSWAALSTSSALLVMFYTMGRWTHSTWAGVFLAGTLLPAVLTVAHAMSLLPSAVLCAAVWGLGRLRRTEVEAIAQAQESRAQAVLAQERIRIARELHDIVAHNVSAMVIQSDGAASALLDEDLAEVSAAIQAIGWSGRTALGELRLLLGVLREAPMQPQPGIEAIVDLVERLPLEVRLDIEGPVREATAGMGLAAYRIVQEALTNTLKHAGKEANAEVLLRYAEDGLHLRVVDDGGQRRRPGPPRTDGDGHGLVGIAERAAMFGGTASAAHLPHGGFQVEVTLPWS